MATQHMSLRDGEKLDVRIIGQGQPILILSGLGMSSWQWLPFLGKFLLKRAHYQFIIPDFRGFGGSSGCAIPELNAIESHWRDVQSLIAQLKLSQFGVIGYSMGATTTMHGIKYGNFAEHIIRYLHIDQTPKIKNDHEWHYGLRGEQQPQMLIFMQQVLNLLTPFHQQQPQLKLTELPYQIQLQLAELSWHYMYTPNEQPKKSNSPNKPPLLQNFLKQHPKWILKILPFTSVGYLYWYVQSYLNHDEDYRDTLMQFKQPTTWMIGRHSELYPSDGQLQIAHRMPHAQILIMEKSGHVPLMNQPYAFQQHLTDFILNRSSILAD